MAFITLSSINAGVISDPTQNWALQYLRLLFGPQLLGMQSDGYIPLLVLVSGALAPLYLSILLFMFMYIGGQGVVKTAMEGEFLGRRWNSIGVPAVMMLCVILLTPVPSQNGVCMGQYLYVRILKLGSNLADIIMVTTINADQMTKTDVIDQNGKKVLMMNVVDRRLSGFMPTMICAEQLNVAGFSSRSDYPALLKDACKIPGELLNYFGAVAEPATQNYSTQYKQEILCYKQAFDQIKTSVFPVNEKSLELYKSKVGPSWKSSVHTASICMINGLTIQNANFFGVFDSRPSNHGWASFANFGSQLNDASARYEAQFENTPVPIIDIAKLGSSVASSQTRGVINQLVMGFNATSDDRKNAMDDVIRPNGRVDLQPVLNHTQSANPNSNIPQGQYTNIPGGVYVGTAQASAGILGAYKFLDSITTQMYQKAADLQNERMLRSANSMEKIWGGLSRKPGRMLQAVGDLGKKIKTALMAWKIAKIQKTAAVDAASGFPIASGIAKAAGTLMDTASVMIDQPIVQSTLMLMFWLFAAAPLLPNVIFALAIFIWLVRCATWFLAIPLATLIVAIPETNVGHSSWREALALALTPAVMVIIYIVSLMGMDLLISILFDGLFRVYIDKGMLLGVTNLILDIFTGEALVRVAVFISGIIIGLIFTSTFILKGADWLFNTIGLRGAHSDLGEMGQLQEKVTSRLMGVSKIL